VRWCVERAGRRVVSLGRGLAELSAKMAAHLGDREAQARLVARAAVESPEDADLVRQAQRLARELGDSELLAMVEEILPSDARALAGAGGDSQLRAMVEEILPSDDRARAILIQAAGQGVDEALDLLLDVELEPLSSEVRRLVLEALASRQEEIGRLDDAEGSW